MTRKCMAIALSALALTASGAFAADDAPVAPGKVTFATEIAPILYSRCVVCHRPGDIAPMSLISYDEVRPWVKSIRQAVVTDKTMPPWHADPTHGKFSNDRRLTEEEIRLIDHWTAQGAPQGDLSKAPAPPTFDEGWRLGQPDLVVDFKEVELPAGGPDVFLDLSTKLDIKEDRWIRAVEVRPGNRKVVHHVIAFMTEGGGPSEAGWLGAWAAGMAPMEFREGTGRLLKAGQSVVADMHYHPADVPQKDQTQIGFYFADTEVKKEVINLWIQNATFTIPAGDPNYEIKSSHVFDQDSHVVAFLPHMHYRGKNFTYTAKYPDGREEVLLHVPKYDFNWQTGYELAEPLAMPKGTRIDCVAHYDNSANNPFNPDPKRNVPFGNQTFDEMMIGFVDYVVDEGLRPEGSEVKIARSLEELKRDKPAGEVYDVTLKEIGEDWSGKSAMHFPKSGEGFWMFPINGKASSATIKDVTRIGPAFAAVVSVQGLGNVQIKGVQRENGTIQGKIYLFSNPILDFEGKSVN